MSNDLIPIETAAKMYSVPVFYIESMIENGAIRGTKDLVHDEDLVILLNKNKVGDTSFFQPRPETLIPENPVTLEEARTRESVARARKAEIEVDLALMPADEDDIAFATKELNRIQMEIAEVQTLSATEQRSRLRLIRFDVFKSLRLAMLKIDRIQLKLATKRFTNRAQRELAGIQLNCLKTQSGILLKLLDKLMPDLKAVEHDFSGEDLDSNKEAFEEIRLRVIEANHTEEEFLLQ